MQRQIYVGVSYYIFVCPVFKYVYIYDYKRDKLISCFRERRVAKKVVDSKDVERRQLSAFLCSQYDFLSNFCFYRPKNDKEVTPEKIFEVCKVKDKIKADVRDIIKKEKEDIRRTKKLNILLDEVVNDGIKEISFLQRELSARRRILIIKGKNKKLIIATDGSKIWWDVDK